MQRTVEEKFTECCDILKKGNVLQAHALVNEILEDALDNEKIQFAVNCFSFWKGSIEKLKTISNAYERGQLLLLEWSSFLPYVKRQKYKADETLLYCFKCGIFTIALNCYIELLNTEDFNQKADICRKIGICYKKLGEYESAKNFLSESNKLKPLNAPVIAELADCYALCGEDRTAKVLFREAFYVDAKKIVINYLDSELIRCLIRKIEDEKNYSGEQLLEWIPVYGNIFGIFTVKRQLKSQEVFKLKQEIYQTENELKDPGCNSSLLTPRLCNLYFWLIDYYATSKEEANKINDILTRIKILDPYIYQFYIK